MGGYSDGKDFEYIEDDEVNDAIAAETQDSYKGFLDDDEDSEEVEAQEDIEEDEETEEQQQEEETEESEDEEEGPPKKTGDREKDGVAHAAYKERQRRKEAEARAAKMEQELAFMRGQIAAGYQLTQQQKTHMQEVEEELAEFDYGDLEKSFDARYEALRKREIARARQLRAQEAEQEWQAIVNASVREAKADYSDYAEVEKAFIARCNTPEGKHLGQLLRKQADPAEWMYRNQKRYQKRVSRKNPEIEALEQEVESLRRKVNGGKPPPKRTLGRARGAKPQPRGSTGSRNQEDFFADVFSHTATRKRR